ncbi:MAG: hypothetical protein K2N28_05055 [Muribaculaceae bacterium]|nr:hypothetical protein [Muribaculaceae bacterium]
MDAKRITKEQIARARQTYAGMSIDAADRDTATAREVKNDVRQLNNNPRNSDM